MNRIFRSGMFGLILAIAAFVPPAAHGQTTAPATRPVDAIRADFFAEQKQFDEAGQNGLALESAASRKSATATWEPLKKMLSLLEELRVADPQSADQIAGARTQYEAFLLLFGDPDEKTALIQRGVGKTPEAAVARAILALGDYVNAGGDAVSQTKAIDAFDAAMKTSPENESIYSLIGIFSLVEPPSLDVTNHLISVLKADGDGDEVGQFVEQLQQEAKLRLLENKPLAFESIKLDGSKFSSADWKGKVIVVDFWATWCPPCLAELPRLEKLYAEYHSQGLEIVGVSSDQLGDDLRKFLAAHPEIAWPQLFQDSTAGMHPLTKKYGFTTLPVVFLIDRQGILRTVLGGRNMEKTVPLLIAEKAS